MNIFFRRKILIISLILVFAMGLSGCANDVEGVVARVNDEDITQEEFDVEFEIYKKTYERQLGEGALTRVEPDGGTLETEIKEMLLDTLIAERLIKQDSVAKEISVTDEEVNERLEDLIDSLGGEEQFAEFLESNSMTREYFTSYTKNDILFNKHSEHFINNVEIDAKEAEDFFNENKEDLIVLKASHILLSTEEDGNRVLQALENGESFEDLVIIESKDSTSAVNGGDLGYIVKGKYAAVPEFEKTIFELEVGEISNLVKTDVGFHIIRLDERKDSFEELKDEISGLLKNQEYANYVKELEEKAKITIYMDIM
ncbi:MAG: hypothetical protein GX053_00515 [Tissierella sp.]|nr:hypothetical protein [Tissierella sp.]